MESTLQKANSVSNKKNNAKLWLMGAAAVLGVGKTAAQDIAPTTKIQDSIAKIKPISPVDLLKPTPMTIGFPTFDKKQDNSFRLEDFIRTVQTDNKSTDIDSLLKLPPRELAAYMKTAQNTPTRVEFETIKIAPINFDKGLNFSSSLINGVYIDGLNIIKMRNFVADASVPEEDFLTRMFIDAINAETPFAYVHEMTHASEAGNILSGLNFEEHIRYVIESEIISRLNEMLARRKVFLENKDMTVAFPRLEFFIIMESRKSGMSKLKNLSLHELRQSKYFRYLHENQNKLNPGKINRDEAECLLDCIISAANEEFLYYFDNQQFLQQIKANLAKAKRQALGQIEFPTFRELSKQRYTVTIGNEDVYFFDLVSYDKKVFFNKAIQIFYEQADGFINDLAPIRKKFANKSRGER